MECMKKQALSPPCPPLHGLSVTLVPINPESLVVPMYKVKDISIDIDIYSDKPTSKMIKYYWVNYFTHKLLKLYS
jgi:hypothetical protein